MKRNMAVQSLAVLVLAGAFLTGCTQEEEVGGYSGPVPPVAQELQERVAREALIETARDELLRADLDAVAGKPEYRLLGLANGWNRSVLVPVVPMEVSGFVRWQTASDGLARVTALVHFYRSAAGQIRYRVLREAGTVSWN